jgi:uncharacterized protein (DUF1800 family)
MIWNQLLAGPDQMRKRMALALSEMFVVSLGSITTLWPSYVITGYWDVLTANAFGNFRQLLEAITLNAGMGFFLNTRGNLKENSRGRQPDENYAREVMQLFTIGLYELNADGTPKLGADNKPVETYGQGDVTNLARVFTGRGDVNAPRSGRSEHAQQQPRDLRRRLAAAATDQCRDTTAGILDELLLFRVTAVEDAADGIRGPCVVVSQSVIRYSPRGAPLSSNGAVR